MTTILRVGDILIVISPFNLRKCKIGPDYTALCRAGICIGGFAIGFSLCVGKGEGYDGFYIYAGFIRVAIATMGQGWLRRSRGEGYKIPFMKLSKARIIV
jgi:hypothetical protein